MSTNAVVQDTAETLGFIRNRSCTAGNIVSAVLDIQRCAVTRDNWIKSLECLSLDADYESEPSGKRQRLANGDSVASSYAPQLLRRTYLNPVSDSEGGREYVAVSYTWNASDEEEDNGDGRSFGGYLVESRKTGELAQPSNVRDVVWERVLNYAEHVKCQNLWIDRECVDQTNEAAKGIAIQNMHLVYSLSRRPVALLTRTIETEEELDILVSILLGDVRIEEEAAAIVLLDDITSNLWWQRAWTFQEDYKASIRMTLVIPHESFLEKPKLDARDFSNRPLLGTLPGEICIKSADFKRQATGFCLSYRRKYPEMEEICNKILMTAGKYNVLLRDEESPPNSQHAISRSMTPTIFADMGRRGISTESDRLAIAANCCGYTKRLDTTALNRRRCSLSISLLALYLLNGEIMENDPQQSHGTLKDTIFSYLAKQSLQSFRPPVDEELTFIKSCRFVDPLLTVEGTQTRGHLWRLGKVIRRSPLKHDKYCTLSPLETFATELHYKAYGAAYTDLATSLYAWTHQESNAAAAAAKTHHLRPNNNHNHQHHNHYHNHQQHQNGNRNPLSHSRPWGWRDWMANEVDTALLEGKALRLASLVSPADMQNNAGHTTASYNAIFVGDDGEDWASEDEEEEDDSDETEPESQQQQQQRKDDDGVRQKEKKKSCHTAVSYAFTSIGSTKQHAYMPARKNVSLEVRVEWSGDVDGGDAAGVSIAGGASYPKLYVKRWLNGLCFAGGQHQATVLFPWPAELLAMSSSSAA
ncbi:hypothetical protein F5Y16DRAFT_357971 [Xylariaceae sp. FL0255]|nr:hypothetical protein F5Y16DRAFT_357971 [Xylariaceae sp. FL0255]